MDYRGEKKRKLQEDGRAKKNPQVPHNNKGTKALLNSKLKSLIKLTSKLHKRVTKRKLGSIKEQ